MVLTMTEVVESLAGGTHSGHVNAMTKECRT
jgi:hypothetical protein